PGAALPPGRPAARSGAARVGHSGPRAAGAGRGGRRDARRAVVPRARQRGPGVHRSHLSIDRRWRRGAERASGRRRSRVAPRFRPPTDGAGLAVPATMTDLGIAFGRVAFVMLFVLNMGGLLTWVERKQSAIMQDRIGANRASIFGFRLMGLFHPLADAIKMLTKEDFRPARADRVLFGLAPFVSVFFALVLFLTAGIAATKRIPFDTPEGESEIIGYFIEYSGMKFGMFAMADFLETVVIAGMTTSLFLGGWQIPYLVADGFRFPWGWAI